VRTLDVLVVQVQNGRLFLGAHLYHTVFFMKQEEGGGVPTDYIK
jgi:hypothetical protein